MIFKDYVDVLVKRWWVLTLAFVVVLTSTYFWTTRQKPVYESQATFVIRPRSDVVLGNDYIRALDTISNRGEINSTFAEVASSQLVKRRAIEQMKLSPEAQRGLSVTSKIIGGANVLQIVVQSYSPSLARDFANAVGEQTIGYTDGLYDVYRVEVLDLASAPSRPIKPNLTLNMTLGALLGLALGAALIFLLESMKPSYKEVDTFNIIDRETGAYNKSYFSHRLLQEMARSRHTKSPLALGFIKVKFTEDELPQPEQAEALRMVRILTEKTIREEDILARFNGVTFAIIFPGTELDTARNSLENVRQMVGSVAHDMDSKNGHAPIESDSSVVSYTGASRITWEGLVEKALKALQNTTP